MRKISAQRSINLFGHDGPIQFDGLSGAPLEVIFQGIKFVEDVRTDDGIMKLVRIAGKADLCDPSVDIVAFVPFVRSSELWYWKEKFWLKGVDKLGVDYYQGKYYALYEIEIENHNEVLAAMA